VPATRSSHVKEVASARELLAINMIRLRAAKGWSQDALALEAGLHRTFVAHVERQARNISLDNIERVALALGVSVRDLFAPLPRGSA
jgi:transcriptional regulator with XRE-family HTH domain